jgi:hypothetical protein
LTDVHTAPSVIPTLGIVMPIARLLEGGCFDPASVAILVAAFNGVVSELGLGAPSERERAATVVIRLARAQSEIDAAKLRAAATAELGG